MRVAVAVPVPLLGELTYLVPPGQPVPPVGARVRVPVGRRELVGCVVAHDATAVEGELRAIGAVLDREPFLPPSIVELCRWTASYYMAGIGDALRAAMPPGAQQGRPAFRTERVVAITAHGLSALTGGDGLSAGPDVERVLTIKQRLALDALAATEAGLAAATLRARGVTTEMVRRLVAKGFASVRAEAVERGSGRGVAETTSVDTVHVLSVQQRQALETLEMLAREASFRVALVHGVTGSGKTEVYLRLVQDVLATGRQALVMVPEIGLTPRVADLFRGVFGSRVAVQHSGLADGERHDQWHRIRRGDVDVVIGTRSAVFAPLPRLGVIVVDEEHDASYKQEEAPRYHGRDLAIVRARAEQALVVLGSATPSLESYQHAVTGKYRLLTLDKRVGDRSMASVELVNMRDEFAQRGPDVVVSRVLEQAIEARLAARQQVVVLLNRRGYATSVFCRQCGDSFECPNCSVSLTVHTTRATGRPHADGDGAHAAGVPRPHGRGRCHYCNYSLVIPSTCRKCAAPYLELSGHGTEKVVIELQARFPEARIGRIDRDAVRRKGSLGVLLDRFGRGEIDVMVGTQMIAKGHDFPNVTLVGVISADVGLGLADFRASERTFQLLTQVTGRAGRGEQPGQAIVQSLFPGHYSVQLGCRQDYPAFFAAEQEFRRGLQYPPFVAMINIIVRGRRFEDAMAGAGDIGRRLHAAATSNMIVLGPAPAPMSRLRGEHRAQLFLKGTRRAEMREALRTALADLPGLQRRVTIDVDPLSVL